MTTKVGKNLRNVYDSVADAKADVSLRVGEKVETLGRLSVNDGGGAKYVVVANATGTDDGGSYHDTANSLQLELITSGEVKASQFGIVDDGVTDNLTQLQNLLTFARKAVFDFSGVAYVSSGLSIPNNGTTVVGEGLATLQTDMTTDSLISLDGADISVKGVKVVNSNGKATGSNAGIVIAGSRCKVSECQATGFGNVGIGTESNVFNAQIEKNICFENKTGISIFKSEQCSVQHNICYQNGTASGVGGGIAGFGDATQNVKECNISNNTCVNNYTHGITCEAIIRSVISNNVLENNGTLALGAGSGLAILTRGVGAVSGENMISNNTCAANSDHGLVIQNNFDATTITNSNSITGNTCTSNQKTGIRLVNKMDNFTITGNTCFNNGQSGSSVGERHGIWLAQAITRCTVVGNNCYSNTDDGIRISDEGLAPVATDVGSGENLVSSNILRSNGAYGVNLYTDTVTSTANSVVNNQMRQNTSGNINDAHTNTSKHGNRFTFDRTQGSATLSSGTATVSTTEVKSGDIIKLTTTSAVNAGALFVSTITDGTSFVITSTDGTDASTVSWAIEH